MKRIRTMGLCLAFALVMGALAAGTTWAAAPEYKTCIKAVSGGEFSDKACSAAQAGGKYKLGAWNQGKKTSFKSKSSKPINYLVNPIEPTNAELNPGKIPKGAVGQFEASKSTAVGELTGPKESGFVESFTKVKSEGKNCNSPGQGKGKIVTNKLGTTLVPLAGGKVAEAVFAAPGDKEENLAEYECEGVAIKVHGAVLAEIIGASGPATKTFTVKVSSRGGEKNNLQEFLKAGAAGTELEEEGAIDAIEVGTCIKLAKKTPSECAGTYGDGEAFSPTTLVSTVSKPAVTLPAAQNNGAGATVKGEAIKIG